MVCVMRKVGMYGPFSFNILMNIKAIGMTIIFILKKMVNTGNTILLEHLKRQMQLKRTVKIFR